MSVLTDTTNHENGGMGDSRIAPTGGRTVVYFQRDRSCRFSPTPPIMKMAEWAIRESPLREVGRGLFSEE